MEQPHDPSSDDLRPRGNRPARGARVVTPGELVEGALRRGDENGDFLGLGGEGASGLMGMAQELANAEQHAHEQADDAPMDLGVLGTVEPAAHDPLRLVPPPAPDIYAGGATLAADDEEGEWEGDLDADDAAAEPSAADETYEVEGTFAEHEEDDASDATAESSDESEETDEESGSELHDGVAEHDDSADHDDAFGAEQGAGYEEVLPFQPAPRRRGGFGAVAALGAGLLVVASLAVVLPGTGLLPFEVPYEVPAAVRELLGQSATPARQQPVRVASATGAASSPRESLVAGTPTAPAVPTTPATSTPPATDAAPAPSSDALLAAASETAFEDDAAAEVATAAEQVVTAAEQARDTFAGLAPRSDGDQPGADALVATAPEATAPPASAPQVTAAPEPVAAPAVVGPQPQTGATVALATPPAAATSGRLRLEGQILPRDQVAVPEIPGALRRATPEELEGRWPLDTVPPMARAAGETELYTPLVGRVRLVTAKGEIFDGRLYSMGKGNVWLESHLGRLALAADTVAHIDRLPETPATTGGKATEIATGERVRVKTAGGLLYGRVMSRDGNRVTILTDSGGRITLVDPVMEPADQKVPGGVLGGAKPAKVVLD